MLHQFNLRVKELLQGQFVTVWMTNLWYTCVIWYLEQSVSLSLSVKALWTRYSAFIWCGFVLALANCLHIGMWSSFQEHKPSLFLTLVAIFLQSRPGKSVFQLKWMRIIRCGMRYFPSRSLLTFCPLLVTHMCNSGRRFSLINPPMQLKNMWMLRNLLYHKMEIMPVVIL